MDSEQLYQELKEIAEKLGITVSEQNLKTSGIKVKSGLCVVRGKKLLVIDKTKSVHRKIDIIADELEKQPLESVYLIPAVRELLSKDKIKESKDTGGQGIE